MKHRAVATWHVKTWDEQTYKELDNEGKLTKVAVTSAIHGDIEGESTLEYLMVYPDDQTATYIGLEHIEGQIAGRSGSFVLQHSGAFKDGVATSTWFVVPNSGRGELRGLRGAGGSAVQHSEQTPSGTLEYEFE